ncbi:MAG: hypothetical protein WEC14_09620 [Chloroflexota bacterium]
MRRLVAALTALLLLAGLTGSAAGAPSVAAAGAVPRVVIIVGPAGAATERYRAEARVAATLARTFTPDVTEIYSPDATWPAVKRALQGASVVVYMGHGNGWPSRYRDQLYPPTQNGFGLNPRAGGDDATHQYFGEANIARSIRLAGNAVVLLHHLCYASGNSEPGLPEGTVDQARQRIDNFAAGFIAAGAAAVVAEAYASPNHMLRAVLAGERSVQAAWRGAPSRNGNAQAFQSERSPGYVAQMDPEDAASGFTRSIVLKAGLAPADVRREARGSASAGGSAGSPAGADIPSLASLGLRLGQPSLDATAAGSSGPFSVDVDVPDRTTLPSSMRASVRWDPLDAAANAPAPEPPDLGLVVPEQLGDIVEPVKAKIRDDSLTFPLAAPVTPGRYRLTVTLHDADGVAFDAATQALIPSLIVRVTGDVDARIVAPAVAELSAATTASIDLWVANLGRAAWGHEAIHTPVDPEGFAPAVGATVHGRWVPLGDDPAVGAAAAGAGEMRASLPAGLQPGVVVPVTLAVDVPVVPGVYLLMLDILTPEHGSLVATGLEPTVIRVHVHVADVFIEPRLPSVPVQ